MQTGLYRRFGTAAVLAWIGLLSAAPPAKADFRLRMDSGSTFGVVVTDQGSGDANPAAGVITTFDNFGGIFTVNVTTGATKPNDPPVGSPHSAAIDLNSITVTSTAAGTFRFVLEDDGYTTPAGESKITAQLGGTLALGSSLSAQAFYNTSNLLPALGPDQSPAGVLSPLALPGGIPAGSVGVFSGGLGGFSTNTPAFSGSNTSFFNNVNGTYSLFEVVTLTFTQAGSASFNFETYVDPAPEPATWVMAFSSLPLIGGAIWIRRRKALA